MTKKLIIYQKAHFSLAVLFGCVSREGLCVCVCVCWYAATDMIEVLAWFPPTTLSRKICLQEFSSHFDKQMIYAAGEGSGICKQTLWHLRKAHTHTHTHLITCPLRAADN